MEGLSSASARELEKIPSKEFSYLKQVISFPFSLLLPLLENHMLAQRFAVFLELYFSFHLFLILASPVCLAGAFVLELYKLYL